MFLLTHTFINILSYAFEKNHPIYIYICLQKKEKLNNASVWYISSINRITKCSSETGSFLVFKKIDNDDDSFNLNILLLVSSFLICILDDDRVGFWWWIRGVLCWISVFEFEILDFRFKIRLHFEQSNNFYEKFKYKKKNKYFKYFSKKYKMTKNWENKVKPF